VLDEFVDLLIDDRIPGAAVVHPLAGNDRLTVRAERTVIGYL
jgi:hypothetical protein